MNDVRKIIYGTVTLFLVVVVSWLSLIFISACGLTLTCRQAAPKVDLTPVPTLVPATLPAANLGVLPFASIPGATSADIVRPSNPGAPRSANCLTGHAHSPKEIFVA